MNRDEFMKELESLLWDIPEGERMEALNYYREYFEDAGEEKEQQVIEELGAPGEVARNIKEGLKENMESESENKLPAMPATEQQEKENGMPTWAIVLIVIGGIFMSPVLLGAAGSLIGVFFSVIGALLGIVVGVGAGTVALLMSALVCFALAISLIPVNGFVSAVIAGGALLLAALGLLMLLATVWIWGALPGFIRWTVRMCKKPFQKKKGGAAA